MKNLLKSLALVITLLSLQTGFAQKEATMVENVTVIQLSQVPGEYETTSLDLAPGNYIFEVTNKNVAKDLGFFLTPADAPKSQIANSGLSKLVGQGETARTGVVELTEGSYQYSCPLNPTPHYQIHVKKPNAIEKVTVVKLSQVPGEYETTSLDLAPGNYIFEVTNQNVDKGLGFFLTPADAPKSQVANSGLSKLVGQGETARTGVVELTEGSYQYSCPLNPTPHYQITVAEK